MPTIKYKGEMKMEYTENLKLNKPLQEEYYNVDDFNRNAEILDAAIAKLMHRGLEYDKETKTLYMSDGDGVISGDSGSYVLPVATRTRLGGVVIGDGINVRGNGTISTDYDSVLKKLENDASEITESEVADIFGSV